MRFIPAMLLATFAMVSQAQFSFSQAPMSKGHWSYKNAKPEIVSFDYGTKLDAGDIDRLSGIDSLVQIYMGFSGVSSEYVTIEGDLLGLGQLKQLEVVCLNKDGIVDHDLKFVASLPKIRELEFMAVNGEGGCTDDCAKFLSKATSLRQLRIHHGRFTDKFVELITKGIPNLEILMLDSPELTDESLRLLAERCKNLRTISIHSDHFTAEGIRSLNVLPKLKNCGVTSPRLGKQISAISPTLLAEDRLWSLDSAAPSELKSSQLTLRGELSESAGVEGSSVVFDGDSVLEVNDSPHLTNDQNGFTLIAWVNPYVLSGDQQMIVAKNRYSLNERQWGVMIDKDNRFRLYVWQGRWVTVECDTKPKPGHWHQIGVSIQPDNAALWVNGKLAGEGSLTKPIPQTDAPLTFGAVDDNGRVWQNFFGALDDIRLFARPVAAEKIAAAYKQVSSTHKVPAPPQPFTLWTGPPIPSDVEQIPFAAGIEHHTINRPADNDYKFLHGAAIVQHRDVMYANWANSPVDENGPHETLRGRRSNDHGVSWSKLEIIAPGFEGEERHSHGVLFVHQGELWTICARFGVGTEGRRFPGLKGEAFVLDEQTDRWHSRGIVMNNCWPYDEPVRMANGNFITGGQDKDGLPVVAISHGDDLTRWDTVLIPYPPKLAPSFAETTVWAQGNRVTAIIRGGANVAWVAVSEDGGRSWSRARASNLPMPRAKAYLGKLSTGQLYLISNLNNRDTLVVSVSEPGVGTLSSMWRIRHGKSDAPRFAGRAKSKQWSYPYGYEHNGKLYIVYSVGKEECGLTTIPLASLTTMSPSAKPPSTGGNH